ncbi:hypothetical protein [Phocaeicola sp.]
MKKIKVLGLSIFVFGFAIVSFIKGQQQITKDFHSLGMMDVEALAGCEDPGGYKLDKYCNPGRGRCYHGEMVANNCISSLV